MRLLRLLGLLLLALLLLPVLPAEAHSYQDPALRTVFDGVQPAVLPPSVKVRVVPSVVDELVVANPTAKPLEVLGLGGEPFLKISSAGVLANLASPDWYATGTPEGGPVPPADVVRDKGKGAPRWALVSHESTWSEFDPRLHPRAAATPEMRKAAKEVVLTVWRIPLRYGGTALAATGHVLFSPVRGGLSVSVTKTPEGVVATPIQGELPGLFLRAPAGRSVEVEGRDGLPFLRFEGGTVQANTASLSWRDDQEAKKRAVVVRGWEEVGVGQTYTWLDPRLRFPADLPSDAVLRSSIPSKVLDWRVPVLLDGAGTEIAGVVTWVPRALALQQVGARPPRAAGLPWWPFALGATAVALGLLVALRRAR
ncbi:MAG: hypothetical protein JWO12_2338 [Frankiales bacterium]|nr:hypothetical protein [Frankiales bacterium]